MEILAIQRDLEDKGICLNVIQPWSFRLLDIMGTQLQVCRNSSLFSLDPQAICTLRSQQLRTQGIPKELLKFDLDLQFFTFQFLKYFGCNFFNGLILAVL